MWQTTPVGLPFYRELTNFKFVNSYETWKEGSAHNKRNWLFFFLVYFTNKLLTGCVTSQSKEGIKNKTKIKLCLHMKISFFSENGWRWKTRYYFHNAGGVLLSDAGSWSGPLLGLQRLSLSLCPVWGPCLLEEAVPFHHGLASFHLARSSENHRHRGRCASCLGALLHCGFLVHARPSSSFPPRSDAPRFETWWAAERRAKITP